jgi:hypothetical protein
MNLNEHTKLYQDGYAMGIKEASVAYNADTADYYKAKQCVEASMESPEVQRMIAKVASVIFREAGDDFIPERAVYEVLQRNENPLTEFSKQAFLYPVLETLSGFEKSAGLSDAISKLFGGLPETAATMAIGGGAALGGLGWLLNRDITSIEDDTEAKLEQARYYRRIAKDLQRRLKAKEEGNPDKKKIKEAVEEAGEGGMLI